MKETIKKWLAVLIPAILAIIAGASVIININNGTPSITIQYSETEVPTLIENEAGEIEEIDAPTVEFVDSEMVTKECAEEDGCLGQGAGADLPYLDISTPTSVKDSLIGHCVDFDGWYGSQCVDPFAYFHYLYTGRWLSTNGTGAAYGLWDARDYNNSGNEYELIYSAYDIQPGDWVIFHNGIYGHVGMALGVYNNGYIALLGANQGGSACPGGGASVNIINMSLASFSGAFRPRIYIQPEPTPEPAPQPETTAYSYKKGDYFSKFLVEQGYSDGTNLWGPEGDVNFYNAQLHAQGILDYRNGKYWNNIPIGTKIILEKRQ